MSVQDTMLQQQALPGTPRQDGFFMPAEWAPQDAVWMLWPYRQDNWRGKAIPLSRHSPKSPRPLAVLRQSLWAFPPSLWHKPRQPCRRM